MKIIITICLFFAISTFLISQPNYLEEPELFQLPLGEPIGGFALENYTVPISLSDTTLAFVYYAFDWSIQSSSLLVTFSTDSGKTWGNPNVIETGGFYSRLAGLKTNSNRLIVIWALNTPPYTLKMAYSDDGGSIWNINTITEMPNFIFGLNVSQTIDQKLWLTYSRRKQNPPNDADLYCLISTNNGDNWTSEIPLLNADYNQNGGFIISGSQSELLFFYTDNSSGNYDIYKAISTNGGTTWSASVPIINSNLDEVNGSTLIQSGEIIKVFYSYYNDNLPLIDSNIDIHYIESNDGGNTWDTPVQFTHYAGPDATPRATVLFNKPFITFSSTRWSGDYLAWYVLIGFTEDNNPPQLGTDNNNFSNLITQFKLSQNYPNPFNPSTKIKFSVRELSKVQLKVYDILGNEIKMLMNEEKPVGEYEVEFKAADLPSGVYFYRMQSGDFIETKKMILLK